jgi:hypothetical protein
MLYNTTAEKTGASENGYDPDGHVLPYLSLARKRRKGRKFHHPYKLCSADRMSGNTAPNDRSTYVPFVTSTTASGPNRIQPATDVAFDRLTFVLQARPGRIESGFSKG